jgi:putative membrane protein
MLLDWALASAHHLAVFTLAAIIAFELALTAGDLDLPTIQRLTRIDAWFGVMAGVVVAAGVARVIFGLKGPDYYLVNSFFWTKMALFVVIGLISIAPTLRYLAWRRAAEGDAAFRPQAEAVSFVRRALWTEAALFAGLPLCAAAMARGFGM